MKMKKRFLLLVLLGFSFSISACEYAIEEQLAIEIATNAALGTPPPPHYQTAAAYYLKLTLTSTPVPTVYGTATMNVQEYSATMIAQEQANNMTQQAQELAFEREKLLAEQRAEQAKGTAAAAERTAQAVDAIWTANAQATNQQATANAQATSQRATEQAQATATAQMLVYIQGTQAAQAQETARVEPTHALWTATAIAIENRIKEGQARDVELSVRRAEMSNGLRAYGPWVIIAFLMVVTSDGFKKWLKTRVFARDEHGKMPLVTMETDNGKKIVMRPDLMTSPTLAIDDRGNIEQPITADPGEQSEVTRRAQAIEAIPMVPQPYAKQGVKMVNTEFGGGQEKPQIFIRNNPALSPVIDEAEAQFMEDNL